MHRLAYRARCLCEASVGRGLLFVFVISIVLVPSLAQTRRSSFDPDGSFWIQGTPPDEFKDFSAINLNAKKLRRLNSPGFQLTSKNFRFKTVSVSREKFIFTTVAIGGLSYEFSGHFLKGGVFAAANLDEKTPVLEGVLIKYKSGKKVAEARLKFTYFGGT